MTHTQPMCSPMHAAIAPVRRRTSASSRPTSTSVTKESMIVSGCDRFASAPPSRRNPLSQATSAAGIFTRAKKWIDA